MDIQGIETLVEPVLTEEVQVNPQQFEQSLKIAIEQPKILIATSTSQQELPVSEDVILAETEDIEDGTIPSQPISKTDQEEQEPIKQTSQPTLLLNLATRLAQTGMPSVVSVENGSSIAPVSGRLVIGEPVSTAEKGGPVVTVGLKPEFSPAIKAEPDEGVVATTSPVILEEMPTVNQPLAGKQLAIGEQLLNRSAFENQLSDQVTARDSQTDSSQSTIQHLDQGLKPQVTFVAEELVSNQSDELLKEAPQPVTEKEVAKQAYPVTTSQSPSFNPEIAGEPLENDLSQGLEPRITTKPVEPTKELVAIDRGIDQPVATQGLLVKETSQKTVTQGPTIPANPEAVKTFQQQNLTRVTELLTQPIVKEGQEVMKLTLQPEKLGQLEVLVKLEEGKISAKFLVGNETVKELFEKSLPILEQTLAKQQITVGKVEVALQTSQGSFDFNGQFEQQQQARQQRGKTMRQSSNYHEQKQVEVVEVADRVDILV